MNALPRPMRIFIYALTAGIILLLADNFLFQGNVDTDRQGPLAWIGVIIGFAGAVWALGDYLVLRNKTK